jgi:hypothetical protein
MGARQVLKSLKDTDRLPSLDVTAMTTRLESIQSEMHLMGSIYGPLKQFSIVKHRQEMDSCLRKLKTLFCCSLHG